MPREELAAALARYEAAELVVAAGTEHRARWDALAVTEREGWEFDPELAREDLIRSFGLASLDGLGVEAGDAPALGAAGALLRYVRELKPGGLPHLARPASGAAGRCAPARRDDAAQPRAGGAAARRVARASRCSRRSTARSPRWARGCCGAGCWRRSSSPRRSTPGSMPWRCCAGTSRGRERLREALDGVRDLERLASRAAMGRATPRELGSLRDSMLLLPGGRAPRWTRWPAGSAPPCSSGRRTISIVLADLAAELARALVDVRRRRSPRATRSGRDSTRSSTSCATSRDGGKQYIAALQARERERTGIGSLKVGYNRVFGYYIEVTRSNLAQVPPDYERRQTLTGAERFVTPELKEYEAKVLGAEERIALREAELFEALRRRVGERRRARPDDAPRCWPGSMCWAGFADLARARAVRAARGQRRLRARRSRGAAIRWSSA